MKRSRQTVVSGILLLAHRLLTWLAIKMQNC